MDDDSRGASDDVGDSEDAREASLLKRLDCHKSKKDPNLKTRFARFDCVIELTMAFGAPPLPVIARDGPIEEDSVRHRVSGIKTAARLCQCQLVLKVD